MQGGCSCYCNFLGVSGASLLNLAFLLSIADKRVGAIFNDYVLFHLSNLANCSGELQVDKHILTSNGGI